MTKAKIKRFIALSIGVIMMSNELVGTAFAADQILTAPSPAFVENKVQPTATDKLNRLMLGRNEDLGTLTYVKQDFSVNAATIGAISFQLQRVRPLTGSNPIEKLDVSLYQNGSLLASGTVDGTASATSPDTVSWPVPSNVVIVPGQDLTFKISLKNDPTYQGFPYYLIGKDAFTSKPVGIGNMTYFNGEAEVVTSDLLRIEIVKDPSPNVPVQETPFYAWDNTLVSSFPSAYPAELDWKGLNDSSLTPANAASKCAALTVGASGNVYRVATETEVSQLIRTSRIFDTFFSELSPALPSGSINLDLVTPTKVFHFTSRTTSDIASKRFYDSADTNATASNRISICGFDQAANQVSGNKSVNIDKGDTFEFRGLNYDTETFASNVSPQQRNVSIPTNIALSSITGLMVGSSVPVDGGAVTAGNFIRISGKAQTTDVGPFRATGYYDANGRRVNHVVYRINGGAWKPAGDYFIANETGTIQFAVSDVDGTLVNNTGKYTASISSAIRTNSIRQNSNLYFSTKRNLEQVKVHLAETTGGVTTPLWDSAWINGTKINVSGFTHLYEKQYPALVSNDNAAIAYGGDYIYALRRSATVDKIVQIGTGYEGTTGTEYYEYSLPAKLPSVPLSMAVIGGRVLLGYSTSGMPAELSEVKLSGSSATLSPLITETDRLSADYGDIKNRKLEKTRYLLASDGRYLYSVSYLLGTQADGNNAAYDEGWAVRVYDPNTGFSLIKDGFVPSIKTNGSIQKKVSVYTEGFLADDNYIYAIQRQTGVKAKVIVIDKFALSYVNEFQIDQNFATCSTPSTSGSVYACPVNGFYDWMNERYGLSDVNTGKIHWYKAKVDDLFHVNIPSSVVLDYKDKTKTYGVSYDYQFQDFLKNPSWIVPVSGEQNSAGDSVTKGYVMSNGLIEARIGDVMTNTLTSKQDLLMAGGLTEVVATNGTSKGVRNDARGIDTFVLKVNGVPHKFRGEYGTISRAKRGSYSISGERDANGVIPTITYKINSSNDRFVSGTFSLRNEGPNKVSYANNEMDYGVGVTSGAGFSFVSSTGADETSIGSTEQKYVVADDLQSDDGLFFAVPPSAQQRIGMSGYTVKFLFNNVSLNAGETANFPFYVGSLPDGADKDAFYAQMVASTPIESPFTLADAFYVPNGSFENGASANFASSNWGVVSNLGSGNVSIDGSTASLGTKSLKIVSTAVGTTVAGNVPASPALADWDAYGIQVKPSVGYELSFDYKTSLVGNLGLVLSFADSTGTLISSVDTGASAISSLETNKWVSQKYQFVVPANTKYMSLAFVNGIAGIGSVNIDNVTLSEQLPRLSITMQKKDNVIPAGTGVVSGTSLGYTYPSNATNISVPFSDTFTYSGLAPVSLGWSTGKLTTNADSWTADGTKLCTTNYGTAGAGEVATLELIKFISEDTSFSFKYTADATFQLYIDDVPTTIAAAGTMTTKSISLSKGLHSFLFKFGKGPTDTTTNKVCIDDVYIGKVLDVFSNQCGISGSALFFTKIYENDFNTYKTDSSATNSYAAVTGAVTTGGPGGSTYANSLVGKTDGPQHSAIAGGAGTFTMSENGTSMANTNNSVWSGVYDWYTNYNHGYTGANQSPTTKAWYLEKYGAGQLAQSNMYSGQYGAIDGWGTGNWSTTSATTPSTFQNLQPYSRMIMDIGSLSKPYKIYFDYSVGSAYCCEDNFGFYAGATRAVSGGMSGLVTNTWYTAAIDLDSTKNQLRWSYGEIDGGDDGATYVDNIVMKTKDSKDGCQLPPKPYNDKIGTHFVLPGYDMQVGTDASSNPVVSTGRATIIPIEGDFFANVKTLKKDSGTNAMVVVTNTTYYAKKQGQVIQFPVSSLYSYELTFNKLGSVVASNYYMDLAGTGDVTADDSQAYDSQNGQDFLIYLPGYGVKKGSMYLSSSMAKEGNASWDGVTNVTVFDMTNNKINTTFQLCSAATPASPVPTSGLGTWFGVGTGVCKSSLKLEDVGQGQIFKISADNPITLYYGLGKAPAISELISGNGQQYRFPTVAKNFGDYEMAFYSYYDSNIASLKNGAGTKIIDTTLNTGNIATGALSASTDIGKEYVASGTAPVGISVGNGGSSVNYAYPIKSSNKLYGIGSKYSFTNVKADKLIVVADENANSPVTVNVQPLSYGSMCTLPQTSSPFGGSMGDSPVFVLDDNTVATWGNGASGLMGNGTSTSVNTGPSVVPNLTNVISASSGANHTLALTSDGRVYAWGDNGSGQLGLGDTNARNVPTLVSSLSNIKYIVAGYQTSAVIDKDGNLYMFGRTANGNAGPTSGSNWLTPTQVTAITNAKQVSLGIYHTIVLLNDGTVRGMGWNSVGQIGNNTQIDVSTPVDIGLTNITTIATELRASYAVDTSGKVWAWGENGYGQLGDGTTTRHLVPTPMCKTGYTGGVGANACVPFTNAIDVESEGYDDATSRGFTLVLASDGTVYSTGGGNMGQHGNGTTSDKINPTQISGITGAVGIATGVGTSFVIFSDGTMKSFGKNTAAYNETGDGTGGTNRLSPVTVANLTVRKIKTVGNGDIQSSVACPMPQKQNPIAAGNRSISVLYPDNSIKVVGYNAYGQLGTADTQDKYAFKTITGLPAGITGVYRANNQAAAMLSNGNVITWGRNDWGDLGNGNTTNQSSPVYFKNASNTGNFTDAVQVALGHYMTFVLKKDGTVWGAGHNGEGNLGAGISGNQSVPVMVAGITNASSIASGDRHGVALLSDGTMKAWGYNGQGQLGNGNTTNQSSPVAVCASGVYDGTTCAGGTKLTNVTAVAAGGRETAGFTLALMNDGTVSSWGDNAYGQLGTGNTTTYYKPAKVCQTGVWDGSACAGGAPLSNIVKVYAEGPDAYALDANGVLWSWGNNDYSQLGNGLIGGAYSNPTMVCDNGRWNGTSCSPVIKPYSWPTGGYTIQWATDGQSNAVNNYSSGSNVNGDTEFFTFDQGDAYTISKLKVWFYYNDGRTYKNVVFQVSNDPAFKTGVTTVFNNDTTNQCGQGIGTDSAYSSTSAGKTVTFTSRTARYIRICSNGSSANVGNHIIEVSTDATIDPLKNIVAFDPSYYGGSAVLSDGRVKSWGLNDYGSLGDGIGGIGYGMRATPIPSLAKESSQLNLGTQASYENKIATDGYGGVAVNAAGSAWAWGISNNGRLGNGFDCNRQSNCTSNTDGLYDLARPLWTLSSGVDSVYGNDAINHKAALMTDGTVKTWGYNNYGQLGLGSTSDNAIPQTIPGTMPKKISGNLVITTDGRLSTWSNKVAVTSGTTDSDSPKLVAGAYDIVDAISFNNMGWAALVSDGRILTWGYNGNGVLGTGNTTTVSGLPVYVPGIANAKKVIYNGERDDVYALLNDGTVKAWGQDFGTSPVLVSGATSVADIALFNGIVFFILNDGTVKVQGTSTQYLGLGATTTTGLAAVAVPGLTNIKKALNWTQGSNTGSVLTGVVGFITNSGDVWFISSSTSNLPVKMNNVSNISDGVASLNIVLLLGNDNKAYTLGNSAAGQLGNASYVSSVDFQTGTPYQLPLNDVSKVFSIDQGMFVISDGKVYSFGSANNWTLVGTGNYTNNILGRSDDSVIKSHTPTQVGTWSNTVDITGVCSRGTNAVTGQACTVYAMLSDGTIKAWGFDGEPSGVTSYNKFGLGWSGGTLTGATNGGTSFPQTVPGFGKIQQVAIGPNATAYVFANGTVKVSGAGAYGELGNGTTSNSSLPVTVQGLNDAKKVGVGSNHLIALLNDGTVVSWGYNLYGNLGNGNTTNQSSPVRVCLSGTWNLARNGANYVKVGAPGSVCTSGAPITNAIDIAVSSNTSYALLSDGSIVSWGRNDSWGERGDGTQTNNTTVASKVCKTGTWNGTTCLAGTQLTGIVKISAGSSSALALDNTGKVWSWGYNANGELGLGNTTNPWKNPGTVCLTGSWSGSTCSGTVLDNVSAITTGWMNSVVVRNDGSVWTWGYNGSRNLTLGYDSASNQPNPVTVLAATTDVVASTNTTGSSVAEMTGQKTVTLQPFEKTEVAIDANKAYNIYATDSSKNFWAYPKTGSDIRNSFYTVFKSRTDDQLPDTTLKGAIGDKYVKYDFVSDVDYLTGNPSDVGEINVKTAQIGYNSGTATYSGATGQVAKTLAAGEKIVFNGASGFQETNPNDFIIDNVGSARYSNGLNYISGADSRSDNTVLVENTGTIATDTDANGIYQYAGSGVKNSTPSSIALRLAVADSNVAPQTFADNGPNYLYKVYPANVYFPSAPWKQAYDFVLPSGNQYQIPMTGTGFISKRNVSNIKFSNSFDGAGGMNLTVQTANPTSKELADTFYIPVVRTLGTNSFEMLEINRYSTISYTRVGDNGIICLAIEDNLLKKKNLCFGKDATDAGNLHASDMTYPGYIVPELATTDVSIFDNYSTVFKDGTVPLKLLGIEITAYKKSTEAESFSNVIIKNYTDLTAPVTYAANSNIYQKATPFSNSLSAGELNLAADTNSLTIEQSTVGGTKVIDAAAATPQYSFSPSAGGSTLTSVCIPAGTTNTNLNEICASPNDKVTSGALTFIRILDKNKNDSNSNESTLQASNVFPVVEKKEYAIHFRAKGNGIKRLTVSNATNTKTYVSAVFTAYDYSGNLDGSGNDLGNHLFFKFSTDWGDNENVKVRFDNVSGDFYLSDVRIAELSDAAYAAATTLAGTTKTGEVPGFYPESRTGILPTENVWKTVTYAVKTNADPIGTINSQSEFDDKIRVADASSDFVRIIAYVPERSAINAFDGRKSNMFTIAKGQTKYWSNATETKLVRVGLVGSLTVNGTDVYKNFATDKSGCITGTGTPATYATDNAASSTCLVSIPLVAGWNDIQFSAVSKSKTVANNKYEGFWKDWILSSGNIVSGTSSVDTMSMAADAVQPMSNQSFVKYAQNDDTGLVQTGADFYFGSTAATVSATSLESIDRDYSIRSVPVIEADRTDRTYWTRNKVKIVEAPVGVISGFALSGANKTADGTLIGPAYAANTTSSFQFTSGTGTVLSSDDVLEVFARFKKVPKQFMVSYYNDTTGAGVFDRRISWGEDYMNTGVSADGTKLTEAGSLNDIEQDRWHRILIPASSGTLSIEGFKGLKFDAFEGQVEIGDVNVLKDYAKYQGKSFGVGLTFSAIPETQSRDVTFGVSGASENPDVYGYKVRFSHNQAVELYKNGNLVKSTVLNDPLTNSYSFITGSISDYTLQLIKNGNTIVVGSKYKYLDALGMEKERVIKYFEYQDTDPMEAKGVRLYFFGTSNKWIVKKAVAFDGEEKEPLAYVRMKMNSPTLAGVGEADVISEDGTKETIQFQVDPSITDYFIPFNGNAGYSKRVADVVVRPNLLVGDANRVNMSIALSQILKSSQAPMELTKQTYGELLGVTYLKSGSKIVQLYKNTKAQVMGYSFFVAKPVNGAQPEGLTVKLYKALASGLPDYSNVLAEKTVNTDAVGTDMKSIKAIFPPVALVSGDNYVVELSTLNSVGLIVYGNSKNDYADGYAYAYKRENPEREGFEFNELGQTAYGNKGTNGTLGTTLAAESSDAVRSSISGENMKVSRPAGTDAGVFVPTSNSLSFASKLTFIVGGEFNKGAASTCSENILSKGTNYGLSFDALDGSSTLTWTTSDNVAVGVKSTADYSGTGSISVSLDPIGGFAKFYKNGTLSDTVAIPATAVGKPLMTNSTTMKMLAGGTCLDTAMSLDYARLFDGVLDDGQIIQSAQSGLPYYKYRLPYDIAFYAVTKNTDVETQEERTYDLGEGIVREVNGDLYLNGYDAGTGESILYLKGNITFRVKGNIYINADKVFVVNDNTKEGKDALSYIGFIADNDIIIGNNVKYIEGGFFAKRAIHAQISNIQLTVRGLLAGAEVDLQNRTFVGASPTSPGYVACDEQHKENCSVILDFDKRVYDKMPPLFYQPDDAKNISIKPD